MQNESNMQTKHAVKVHVYELWFVYQMKAFYKLHKLREPVFISWVVGQRWESKKLNYSGLFESIRDFLPAMCALVAHFFI